MKITILLLIGLSILSSCSKFLDQKPDAKLNTPSTNKDLVAILDNNSFLNPALLEIATDNYYLNEANYNGITTVEFREAYSWSKEPTHNSFWNNSYQTIFYSNTVLDYIDRVKYELDGLNAEEIRGMALFHRAFAYYSLVQVFCKYFNDNNRNSLGLVLKLNSDINENLQRSNLEDTYELIITDLKSALALLPDGKYAFPVRPNKAAAHALLSRIYLGISRYQQSIEHAISALQFQNETLDFKIINVVTPYPFFPYNHDVYFFATIVPTSVLVESRAFVDTVLFNSYTNSDLRKSLFYTENTDENILFTGNYNSFDQGIFCGPTVAEMLLNKAEIECRNNELLKAKNSISKILETRYIVIPELPSNKESLLEFILEERRKELFFRGVRWTDIRRLTSEGKDINLRRIISDKEIDLSGVEILNFAYKIPLQALDRGKLEQNP
jgi:tetratricopeptide (TPR) repeat protein